MDNDPKHTAKATQDFFLKGKEVGVLQWPNLSPDLNTISVHFTKVKHPKNKQDLKTAAVKAWQRITGEETQRLMMSGFQTSGSH